ncbi:kicstor complex protein c12orf66-like isoform x3 [Dermatophagoides farinae]|uniref:Kicstor complex protein c12orf66-like isoform x3 n=1 Tax=Dermatophagoides farinae TaxID=6954 RepID=A0A9D4P3Y5_DERFA|nr:uncharacterized protein LOC124497843 [Dermatophagoides farinae]KAH7643453.1 kicstor complex protein c12orf66-like isoform x3 [Dermatophagoides farinae]
MAGKKNNAQHSTLTLATHSTIQNVELILERFFDYHITYQWDKAKEYIEHERDQFRAKNSHSILTSMLHYLAQLIIADRNYLTLQFFSSKVFQRKDLLKSTYDNLKIEFQRLEERSNQLFLRHNFHLLPFQSSSSPIHSNSNNGQQQVASIGGSIGSINDVADLVVEEALADDSEPAKEALDCIDIIEAVDNENSSRQQSPIFGTNANLQSSSLSRDQSSQNTTKSTFFSKLFRRFSSTHSVDNVGHSNQTKSSEMNVPIFESLATEELTSSIPPPPPPPLPMNLDSFNHLDSLDQFAGHLCGQLIIYCKVRVEMIDFYERLATVAGSHHQHCQQQQQQQQTISNKFLQLDDFLQTLNDIHSRAEDSFHHPVLTRLKIMFMFECDIMLALVRGHQSIQQWRYLESLFALQEAHNKIGRLANPKEFFIGNQMLLSMVAGNAGSSAVIVNGPPSFRQNSLPPTTGGQQAKVNQTSASSGQNNNQIPLTGSTSSSPSVANINTMGGRPYSPLSPNFVYPNTTTGTSSSSSSSTSTKFLFRTIQQQQQQQHDSGSSSLVLLDSKSIPSLIQWFNRFKLFLLSKYSFYFHSLLMIHLTPIQSSGPSSSSSSSSTTTIAATSSSPSSTIIQSMTLTNSLSSLINQSQYSPTSNYQQTDNYMRNLFARHGNHSNQFCDFHSRIVQFIRKIGSDFQSCIVLVWNIQGKSNASLAGYRAPHIDSVIAQGRSPLPIIYCYPLEANMNRHPFLIMIMESHSNELNNSDVVVIEHDRNGPQQSTTTTIDSNHHGSINSLSTLLNGTYFLTRPDPDMTLSLIVESKRPITERDQNYMQFFMQDLSLSLRDTKILQSFRMAKF